jgi:rod shape-determining protein MreC
MFRALFSRRGDWTVLVTACSISITLMLLEGRSQARVAWFLQHTLLAPFEAAVGWVDNSVGVYWQNQQLRRRLAELQIETDDLRAERVENTRLRKLLELEARRPYDLIASSVIGRSLDRLGGSLTIDRGHADGVEPGQAILTPDGLVGRVDQTTAHTARVLTLLHRDCAVAVRVDRSRVDGVLEWNYGSNPILSLRYVSSQEDVQVGDLIVTSGLGGIFPQGIRIGRVSRVGIDDNGLMKEISVRPAVDFRALEEVLVYAPSSSRGSTPADLFLEAPADTARTDSTAAAARPKAPAGAGATAAGTTSESP